tara:strand:- start:8523 stop:10895 length:2373 start_codon:yes stop_codon:yes gene_type:complete
MNKYIVLILLIFNIAISEIVISGFITNQNTGEALIGANIFISDIKKGTTTDKNGFYSIIINENLINNKSINIIIQYLGYETITTEIDADSKNAIILDFELSPQNIKLQSTEIKGEQEARQTITPYSSIKVTQSQLSSLPSLAEADIFRTLQAIPGVLQLSEFSTGLVIRGGNTDQNLILLDGITVYNPSHLGGLFSNFIVDAVKEANLTKGGFNAEYGGRLSAVLDVISREGNRKNISGKIDVSLLSAKTTLEGPFYKGAWLIAGRRTYFDIVFSELGYTSIPPYYFYDIQGHVFTDLTYKDRVSISFYQGVDDFEYGDLALEGDWGNETISLKYRRLFNQKLIGNFMIAKSKFFVNFGLGGSSGINEADKIDDITFSGDLSYFLNNNVTVKSGYQYKTLGFAYESFFDTDTLFSEITNPKEVSAYSQIKFVLNDKLIIEPGFRMNYYDSNDKQFYPNFRLGLKYIIKTDEFINFAIGNYNQFLFTFQDDFNPPLLDAWIAIDKSVEAGRAEHFVLGYERYIKNYKFQIEGYYKNMYNMLTFVDQRATTDEQVSDEDLSDILTPSDGNAGGLELFVQKLKGNLTGWLAYTLSYSIKEMNGTTYFTNWDRRHVLNFIGNYKFPYIWLLGNNWEFNWKFTYQTGQAYTPILGYYLEDLPGSQTTWKSIPGGRNSGRLPDYHRLDLGITKSFKITKKIKGAFFAQAINVYGRENIFRYLYTTENIPGVDDNGNWNLETDDWNGDGEPGFGINPDTGEFELEPNIDEAAEDIPSRQNLSIFSIMIPSIGFSIEF